MRERQDRADGKGSVKRSLEAGSHTGRSDLFLAVHRPSEASAASLINLQQLAGASAVAAVLRGRAPAHVQRRMAFSAKDLGEKPSLIATLDHSTFTKMHEALHAYHRTKVDDTAKQVKRLKELQQLAESWLSAHSKDDQDPKHKAVNELWLAASSELEVFRPILEQRAANDALTEIDLPLSLMNGLKPDQRRGLVQAAISMQAGRSGDASTELAALKTHPAFALIRGRLQQHFAAQMNPELSKVLDPAFKLDPQKAGDMATLDAAADHVPAEITRGLGQMAAGTHPAYQNAPKPANPKPGDPPWKDRVEIGKGKASDPMMKLSHSEANLRKIASDLKAQDKRFSKLEVAEIMALTGYTTDFYGGVNSELRAFGKDAGALAWAQAAVSGMHKLPPHPGRTYRHVGLFPGFSEVNQVGATVSDLAFSSSAVLQAGCANAGERHDVLELITSRTGRDISSASVFGKGEAEILFLPGTRFRVRARLDRTGHTWDAMKGLRGLDAEMHAAVMKDAKRTDLSFVLIKEEV